MAIKFIRSNKFEGVTAYQDAVLFHNSKGANGILKNVANQLAATYNSGTETLTIDTGQAIAYGRQFEVDEALEMDFGALGPVSYITIYAEIDLSDPTAETVTFKSVYQALTYPIVNAGDNLISIKEGVYNLVLYHLHKEVASGTVTLVANIIEADKIAKAAQADVATAADDSGLINGVKISHNASTKKIEVKVTSASATEIIERRRVVYTPTGGYATEGWRIKTGESFSLTEDIAVNDIIEFHLEDTFHNKFILRAIVGYINKPASSGGQQVPGITLSLLSHGVPYSNEIYTLSVAYFAIEISDDFATCWWAWRVKGIAIIRDPASSTDTGINIKKIYKIVGGA